MAPDITNGWSVPWQRSGHFSLSMVKRLDFNAFRPSGWWFATKTRVYVRPAGAPWVNDIEITVEGISEPICQEGKH